MSNAIPAEPVKLIFSLFAKEESLINETISTLSSAYGEPDFISEVLPFDYTDYYGEELGGNLLRRFPRRRRWSRFQLM
ncbi:MAG: DUF4416 family protein, partial [Smithella sp.]|nr:DUF4416 family protein [Smithella sp.]